jgi:hypothetical protein
MIASLASWAIFFKVWAPQDGEPGMQPRSDLPVVLAHGLEDVQGAVRTRRGLSLDSNLAMALGAARCVAILNPLHTPELPVVA